MNAFPLFLGLMRAGGGARSSRARDKILKIVFIYKYVFLISRARKKFKFVCIHKCIHINYKFLIVSYYNILYIFIVILKIR